MRQDVGGTLRYHLGWHRLDVRNATAYLVYTLISVSVTVFRGRMELPRISFSGLPMPGVLALAEDLACPRRPDDTEGAASPVEARLIRVVHARAGKAGNLSMLPEIVPTTRFPGWSRLELTDPERSLLLRAGGF